MFNAKNLQKKICIRKCILRSWYSILASNREIKKNGKIEKSHVIHGM